MQRISFDQFGQEVLCVYRGENYAVRDNGAICRQQRPNMRRRPHDGQWTFGTPCNHAGSGGGKAWCGIEVRAVRTCEAHSLAATAKAPSSGYVADTISVAAKSSPLYSRGKFRLLARA